MTIPKKKKGSFKKGLKTFNQTESDKLANKRKKLDSKEFSSDFPDEDLSYIQGLRLRF